MRTMRLFGVVVTAILFAVFGTTVLAYGQHGSHGKGGDKADKGERGKPGGKQEHPGKAPQRGPERAAEQHRPARAQHVEPRRDQRVVVRHEVVRKEQRVVWQGHRAREWAHEHRTWQQRGGYHGYRIPRDRYIAYFGPAHRFRVHTLPVVIFQGHPRFRCNGFWFTLIDPWPEYWAVDWYSTDDVYVEYVHDGYYLYNARHPGVAIAINVSL